MSALALDDQEWLDQVKITWLSVKLMQSHRTNQFKGPPRRTGSPDLTPMDASSWGIVKPKVYARTPCSLDKIQNFIREEFASLHARQHLC